MKRFFVTLVYELQGYCIVAYAPDENTLRQHLHDYYGKLWCSVYEKQPSEIVIGEPLYL